MPSFGVARAAGSRWPCRPLSGVCWLESAAAKHADAALLVDRHLLDSKSNRCTNTVAQRY